MNIHLHIICSRKSKMRITSLLSGIALVESEYWKDSACLELRAHFPVQKISGEWLMELLQKISGMSQIQINRQLSGTEYVCYATMEEIKNDGKAFVVCFVDMKENEL